MAYCGKCLHLDVCKTAETCDGHVPRCKHFIDKTAISQTLEKPKTRGDQLRRMTDEQLAEALYENAECKWCHNDPACGALLDSEQGIEDSKCVVCVLAWVKESVEDKQ